MFTALVHPAQESFILYKPTLRSVKQHPLPDWYANAKLGIFIHWGLPSVPAYAPTRLGDMQTILKQQPQEYFFTNQPYAEWYWNSLRIPESLVNIYHARKYGTSMAYEKFAAEFNLQAQKWQPAAWAELFKQAGARYVVLVTKHHDGFLMWSSRHPNPMNPDYAARRDIPGELTAAVRKAGLRMGFYYSSALDWTFTTEPIRNFADLLTSGPTSTIYLNYVRDHWQELIERHAPDILWSDIGYPPGANLAKLFADYYNRLPHGVVNDRWSQFPPYLRTHTGKRILNWLVSLMLKRGSAGQAPVAHCDFVTTEYTSFAKVQAKKWEACRGIGNSFAYNEQESDQDYLTAPRIITMLVDIVSKNGNLLLNVGPRPDGSLPEPQVKALQGLGAWLSANGESIYDTHPWVRPVDALKYKGDVHYTCKGSTLYAHVNTTVIGAINLPNPGVVDGSPAVLLDNGEQLRWVVEGDRLEIQAPKDGWLSRITPVIRLQLKG